MGDASRIAVLGAGSVGCFIGGAWKAAGLDVTLVGRQRIGTDIAANGMQLSAPDGWKARIPAGAIPFSTSAKAIAKADIILLTVKSNATEAAAKQIGANTRPDATIISFQNGVSNVETLKQALPGRTVLAGVVPFNVAYLGHGRWLKGTAGNLIVERSDLTLDLASRIGEGPAALDLSDDMAGIAWGKLLINLNNAVNALSGKTLLEQLGTRDYRRVVAASIVEALDLLDAAGIVPAKIGPLPPKLLPHAIAAPDFIFRNLFLRVQKVDPQARSSMADDFKAGRATEIDHLNGEVVRLAKRLEREAPVNSAIVALVRQAEAGVERVWSPAELRDHVLKGRRTVEPFGY